MMLVVGQFPALFALEFQVHPVERFHGLADADIRDAGFQAFLLQVPRSCIRSACGIRNSIGKNVRMLLA